MGDDSSKMERSERKDEGQVSLENVEKELFEAQLLLQAKVQFMHVHVQYYCIPIF